MVLTGKNVYVISGASRGIGKEIALQLADKAGRDSVFLITARNYDLLKKVRDEMLTRNDFAKVYILATDLAMFDDDAVRTFTIMLDEIAESGPFDSLYLIHNAGTMGDVSKPADQLNDAASWQSYLAVNLVSMIQLNSVVLQEITDKVASKRYVINISSLVALQGFPSLSQYCVGKSARESFFRVLASEDSNLRILSYSPGPVDTEFPKEFVKSTFHDGMRAAFSRESTGPDDARRKLSPKETVSRMVGILEKDEFVSGGRIDYFDKE